MCNFRIAKHPTGKSEGCISIMQYYIEDLQGFSYLETNSAKFLHGMVVKVLDVTAPLGQPRF